MNTIDFSESKKIFRSQKVHQNLQIYFRNRNNSASGLNQIGSKYLQIKKLSTESLDLLKFTK